jgi:SNF2 family DNA or RNA helicase
MRTAKKQNKTIILKFYSDDKDIFYNLLEQVKSINGRKWESKTKSWVIPLSKNNISILSELDFELCPELKRWVKKSNKNKSVNIKVTNKNFYPFQKEGIIQIERFGGKTLLADKMGLGKTLQSIGWFNLQSPGNVLPMIIIAPSVMKVKWKREILIWSNYKEKDIHILYGRKGNAEELKNRKILIINYDIVANTYKKELDKKNDKIKKVEQKYTGWKDYLIDINSKLLILDESHFCKNEQAKRTKAIQKLSRNINNIIAISGTPITKRPIDLYTSLNIIDPDTWNSKWKFAHRYCDPQHNGFGWEFKGATNIEELHKILVDTMMIRRLKKDVLPDLPSKQKAVIPVELDPEWIKEYQHAEAEILDWVEINEGVEKALSASRAEAIVRIEKLKQITIKGKLDSVKNWIDNFLESDKKLVVACTHQMTIDYLVKHFKDISVSITGKQSAEEKDTNALQFQNNESIKLAICNIEAAGVGIDLYAASDILTVEIGKSSVIHDQMDDRIHRIGQEADKIISWWMLAIDTIEEDLIAGLDEERKVIEAIIDGKETAVVDMVSKAFEGIKKRRK